MPDKKDSCYSCVNGQLCFLRRDIRIAITGGIDMLNIDGDLPPRPGTVNDIIHALGAACMKYEQREE